MNDFRNKNRDVEAAAHQEKLNMKQVARVVGGLSDYNEMISRYSLHRYLIDLILKRFVDEGLNDVSELEQNLMTGVDSNKSWVKPGKLIPKIVQKMREARDEIEKLRLALLTIVCLELKEKHRRLITDTLETKNLFLISKLGYFGIQPQTAARHTVYRNEEELREIAKKTKTIEKIYNYYEPKLASYIRMALENNLDPTKFIFGRAAPPALQGFDGPVSVGTSLRKKPAVLKSARGRKRLIVFILGGLSYSEIRLMKDFPQVQLILGGNRIVSPLDFLEELDSLERNVKSNDSIDARDVRLQI